MMMIITWAAGAEEPFQPNRHQVPAVQALHVCSCCIDEGSNAAAGLVTLAARLICQVPRVYCGVIPAGSAAARKMVVTTIDSLTSCLRQKPGTHHTCCRTRRPQSAARWQGPRSDLRGRVCVVCEE